MRLLQSRPLPADVGVRIKDLGFELPDLDDVRLGGVLRAPGTQLDAIPPAFTSALMNLLNRPFEQQAGPTADPVVGPPIYGRFHARMRRVPTSDQQPMWLRQLNIDPRFRALAGFGATVIQDAQDELMHSAWQQLLGIEQVRQLRRQARLAVETGRAIHNKHLAKFSLNRIYPLISPLRSRVCSAARFTLQSTFIARRVTPAATSTVFRRVTRPRGPIMRRLAPATEGRPRALAVNLNQGLFLRLAGGGRQFPYVVFTHGMVTSQQVADQFARMEEAARRKIFHPKLTVVRNLVPSARAFNDYLRDVAKVKRFVLFHRDPNETRNAFQSPSCPCVGRRASSNAVAIQSSSACAFIRMTCTSMRSNPS